MWTVGTYSCAELQLAYSTALAIKADIKIDLVSQASYDGGVGLMHTNHFCNSPLLTNILNLDLTLDGKDLFYMTHSHQKKLQKQETVYHVDDTYTLIFTFRYTSTLAMCDGFFLGGGVEGCVWGGR